MADLEVFPAGDHDGGGLVMASGGAPYPGVLARCASLDAARDLAAALETAIDAHGVEAYPDLFGAQ